ncbi:hypothetical protein UIS_01577 [Enterococcus faecium EnGen0313]|nr:hypothetical protein UIS_01577 [Enterococcus faecium EnGen0313]
MENETDVIYIHPQKRIVSQKRKYFYLSFTDVFFFLLACFLILLLIIGVDC